MTTAQAHSTQLIDWLDIDSFAQSDQGMGQMGSVFSKFVKRNKNTLTKTAIIAGATAATIYGGPAAGGAVLAVGAQLDPEQRAIVKRAALKQKKAKQAAEAQARARVKAIQAQVARASQITGRPVADITSIAKTLGTNPVTLMVAGGAAALLLLGS